MSALGPLTWEHNYFNTKLKETFLIFFNSKISENKKVDPLAEVSKNNLDLPIDWLIVNQTGKFVYLFC